MKLFERESIRFLRIAGVEVRIHWYWVFVLPYVLIVAQHFQEPTVRILFCLGLLATDLLHELGHVFACRMMGGHAHRIVLWPFGGVPDVNPPARPGAVLWTAVAGPLVNLALYMVIFAVTIAALVVKPAENEFAESLVMLAMYNTAFLIFNLAPIYPLDGGQILQALAWYASSRATSLRLCGILGMIFGSAFACFLLLSRLYGLAIYAAFLVGQSWNALRRGRELAKWEALPRYDDLRCPECLTAPPIGVQTSCDHCEAIFHPFEEDAYCTECGDDQGVFHCVHCEHVAAPEAWYVS